MFVVSPSLLYNVQKLLKLKIWDPEQDLHFIEKCVDKACNISNLQMPNRTLLDMLIRLLVLKEMFGSKYADILVKC
jgi:hypothetical protein